MTVRADRFAEWADAWGKQAAHHETEAEEHGNLAADCRYNEANCRRAAAEAALEDEGDAE